MKHIASAFALAFAFARSIAVAETVEAPVIPFPDPSQDREPAIIVQRTGAGVDRVITAWIRRTASSGGQLQVAAINASNLNGVWETPALPCPLTSCGANFESGDPYLAENGYNYGTNPKRVYLIGTSLAPTTGENQITVWWSYGAAPWTIYAKLDHRDNAATWVTDKPSIAVSWQSSTLGYVYAAHLRYDNGGSCNGSPCNSRIIVTRVDTGGTGGTPLADIDSGGPNTSSPIMLAHYAPAGWLFVAWLNWDTNEIKVATSYDGFASYSIRSASAGTLLGVGGGSCIPNNHSWINSEPNSTGCIDDSTKIRARSVLMARYNAVAGTIGITWHARETTTARAPNYFSSDVKFIEFNPSTLAFGTRYTVTDSQTPGNPEAPTSGAQWNPALDYDGSGQYLVSYYDTRGATQYPYQFNYHVKTARIYSNGVRTGAPDTQVTTAQSNLRVYADNPTNGEYMDIWSWNNQWYTAFIQIGTQGDAAVSRLTP